MGRTVLITGRGMASNCYLYTDGSCTASVVIDPSVSPADLKAQLDFSLPPVYAILLTHVHADHLIRLADWVESTGAPIFVGSADAYALTDPDANLSDFLGFGKVIYPSASRSLSDGDTFRVGEEKIKVLSTPGHTTGSICYLTSDGALFSGDTIYAEGGYGRTDFFGGSELALDRSIAYLMSLDPKTTVYPGHGCPTDIKTESLYHSFRFR